jgi:hypothetical protein
MGFSEGLLTGYLDGGKAENGARSHAQMASGILTSAFAAVANS